MSENSNQNSVENTNVDLEALLKIKYGIYIVTSINGKLDCGCIINTVQQVTQTPPRISVTINKESFTCSAIEKTGIFNVSVLTQKTAYDIIERFGFHSSKDYNKFSGLVYERTDNGIACIKHCSNAIISAKVEKTEDLDTHIMFIARLTYSSAISDKPTLSYDYYLEKIKPKTE